MFAPIDMQEMEPTQDKHPLAVEKKIKVDELKSSATKPYNPTNLKESRPAESQKGSQKLGVGRPAEKRIQFNNM